MFWLFFFLAVFSLKLSKILYKSYLSPIGIFGGLWNGLLALFEARLIEYYPLSLETCVLFLGSYLFFVFGTLLATWPVIKVMQTTPPEIYKAPFGRMINLYRARKMIDVLTMISLLGLVLTIWRMVQLVGWGAIFAMDTVRSVMSALSATGKLGGGIVGYLSSLIPLNAIISGVYWVYVPRDWKRIGLIFIISLGQAWLTGNRTVFIWTTILFFAAYMLTRTLVHRESVIRLVRPILFGAVVLFIVFGIIGMRRFDPENAEEMHANVPLPWVFLHAYHYVTSGFAAFSVHLDEPDSLPIPGALTLSPVIRMLARIDTDLVGGYSYETLLVYTTSRASVATPARTNVFTYLGQILDDFGLAGVLVIPWGIGFISGLVFQRLLVHPNFSAIACYAFFCLQFVYSSTLVITLANSILVSLIALTLVQKFISIRGKNVSSMLPVISASGVSEQSLRRL